MSASPAALQAATWAVNLEDPTERARLFQGHMARRVPIMKDGYRATDFSAADSWLISEHAAATAKTEG